jgi:hypothetical protein
MPRTRSVRTQPVRDTAGTILAVNDRVHTAGRGPGVPDDAAYGTIVGIVGRKVYITWDGHTYAEGTPPHCPPPHAIRKTGHLS